MRLVDNSQRLPIKIGDNHKFDIFFYQDMKLNTITVAKRIVSPSKIVCVGRNYVAHIEELGNEMPDQMVVFVKPNSSISDQLFAVRQEPLHYEGELSFLFNDGQFSAIGFGLDLTKRDLQSKLKSRGLPWERAKAFDGAALFSPFVEISGLNPDLSLELEIDGEITQAGGLDLMIYQPAEILAEIQTFMTLNNGDIVMTGTPKGVGQVSPGQVFKGRVKENGKELTSAQWISK